jgi:hypothetical protein
MICHNVPSLEPKHFGQHMYIQLINTICPKWGFILSPDNPQQIMGVRIDLPYSDFHVSKMHFLQRSISRSEAIIFSALTNKIAEMICAKYNGYRWFNGSDDIDPTNIGANRDRLENKPLFNFSWDRIMSPLLSKKLPDSTLGSVGRAKQEFLIAPLYFWHVTNKNKNDLAENSSAHNPAYLAYLDRKILESSLPPDEWTHAF